MFRIFLVYIILIFSLTKTIKNQSLKKPTLSYFVKVAVDDIADRNRKRLNAGLEPIEYDDELMKKAQREAKRLANIGELEPPRLNLDQNYVGFSFKVTGIIGSTRVGTRICFDNMTDRDTEKIYDYKEICYGPLIDQAKFTKVGFGYAADSDKNVYGVRIYYTDQQSQNGSANQEEKTKTQKKPAKQAKKQTTKKSLKKTTKTI